MLSAISREKNSLPWAWDEYLLHAATAASAGTTEDWGRLELKIPAIRKMLSFVMSIWLNSQFSANLVRSDQNSSVPLTGGSAFAALEVGSQVLPFPGVRRWPKHCSSSSSSSLVPGCSCAQEELSPLFFCPSVDPTAAWAVHEPSGKNKLAVWQLHSSRGW